MLAEKLLQNFELLPDVIWLIRIIINTVKKNTSIFTYIDLTGTYYMHYSQIKRFTNRYFSTILLAACAAGFFIPSFGDAVVYIIPCLLATIIFTSFFQVNFSKDAVRVNLSKAFVYYLIRFIAVPVVLFFIIQQVSPFYAQAFFLLLLAPAAVASPTFTRLFGGNTDLAVASVVISNTFAIISIPFFSSILVTQSAGPVDGKKMLVTLVITILIPFLLHFPFRTLPRFKRTMISVSPVITVICLSILVISAVSKYKTAIFGNLQLVAVFALFTSAAFVLMYIGVYYCAQKSSAEDKVSYAVCSGANNIGLAITLAILYFSPEIKIFFIVAQITWTVTLIPVKYFFCSRKKCEY